MGHEQQADARHPSPVLAEVAVVMAFAEQTHGYISDYIKFADQKAAFVFTATTALLAFLYQAGASRRWLRPPWAWTFGDGLAFLAMLGLGMAALVSVVVIVPRLSGARRGFVFWESVAEFPSGADYTDAVLTLTAGELSRAKLEHCWELAGVCRRKYRVLGIAIWIGAFAVYTSVVYLMFF